MVARVRKDAEDMPFCLLREADLDQTFQLLQSRSLGDK